MQRDDIHRLFHAGDLRLQRFALLVERRGARAEHGRVAEPLGNGVDETVDLACEGGRFLLRRRTACAGGCGEALPLRAVGGDIFRDDLRLAQLALQPGEKHLLDRVEIEDMRIGAAARLAVARTGDARAMAAVRSRARQGAAAGAATQQAGKRVPVAALHFRTGAGTFGLARLHGLEDLARDDGEIRPLAHLPVAFRVRPRHAAARLRVLHHRDAVPDHAAGIKRIAQYAVHALRVAVDRARIPGGAARRRHLLRIQRMGDGAGTFAGRIILEDAAHDGGFGFVDRQCAALSLDRAVAIGPAAARQAVAHAARHAAPDLVGIVLAIELADQAATGYVMTSEVFDFPLLHKAAGTTIILSHVSKLETVDYTGDMNFRIRDIIPLSWHDIGAGVPAVTQA